MRKKQTWIAQGASRAMGGWSRDTRVPPGVGLHSQRDADGMGTLRRLLACFELWGAKCALQVSQQLGVVGVGAAGVAGKYLAIAANEVLVKVPLW